MTKNISRNCGQKASYRPLPMPVATLADAMEEVRRGSACWPVSRR